MTVIDKLPSQGNLSSLYPRLIEIHHYSNNCSTTFIVIISKTVFQYFETATFTNYIKHHKHSYHSHIITISLYSFKSFQKFFQTFSLSLSHLQIKPKTLFPSSSIFLQWINTNQMLFSFSANTLRKNAGHGVKMQMLQAQRFLLLKWSQG